MKLCDTCIYRNNVEQLKPCIIYRDDCKLYERGNMSNEDAVNIIKSGLDNNSIDCFDIKQYMAIDMAIKALEQEPKTGHWEWVQYDENPKLGDWHCSECRCVVVECVYKNEKGGIPLYKYCPQCGRRMVEPQERSE